MTENIRPSKIICNVCQNDMRTFGDELKCPECGNIQEKIGNKSYRKECEECHDFFEIEELDYCNGKFICRDCESIIKEEKD